MFSFACPNCGALIFFENSVCVTCGSALGFVRAQAAFLRLTPRASDGLLASADGSLLPCANIRLASCNWLTPDGGLCSNCSLTRTRPADSETEALAAFARTETDKRRLLFQLDRLGLPTTPRSDVAPHGLAFDLLSSSRERVVTGHDDGVITIDLAEGSDPHREAVRANLGEPYRTLLGHLRHEIGHWYWTILVDGAGRLEPFRALFGDERADYAAALSTHYGSVRDDSWRGSYVTDYASAHPWEDWAECFAHYLHLTDTLQSAYWFGIRAGGPALSVPAARHPSVSTSARASFASFDEMLDAWLSLTFALNAVNRSMGKDDLYPFVLVPPVIEKLRFVHEVVTSPPL